jgi:hypothetical protein
MKQPTGFIEPGNDIVCQLKKYLCGTKQGAHQWYLKIQSCMIKNGYKSCSADNCIFIKKESGKISMIRIYADDLIIACCFSEEAKAIITFLKESFSSRNLQYCLCMKIDRVRPNGQMFLSHKHLTIRTFTNEQNTLISRIILYANKLSRRNLNWSMFPPP